MLRHDVPRLEPVEALDVHGTVTLLEPPRDALLGIRPPPGRDDALAAGYIRAGGFLAENVLTGLDSGLHHARVLKHGRGDDHRVHVGGQQFLEVLVRVRLLGLDLLDARGDLLLEDVAESGDTGAGVGVDEGGVVGAAIAP